MSGKIPTSPPSSRPNRPTSKSAAASAQHNAKSTSGSSKLGFNKESPSNNNTSSINLSSNSNAKNKQEIKRLRLMYARPTRSNMVAQLSERSATSGLAYKSISIHRRNLKQIVHEKLKEKPSNPQKMLVEDDVQIDKNEYLSILKDYECFNPEKFKKLNNSCSMKDILLTLDLPKYKYEEGIYYFNANSKIKPLKADYSSSDVSDSDEEFENKPYSKFILDKPLKANDTSIWCKDGPIKGDILIDNCHYIIFKQLEKLGYGKSEESIQLSSSEEEYSSEEDHSSKEEDNDKNKYLTILGNLGNYMYEHPVCSEKGPLKAWSKKEVISEINSLDYDIKFSLIRAGITTRLINPGFELLDFSVNENKTGLTYKQINAINEDVLKYLAKILPEPNTNVNQILAKLQLARLSDNEHHTEKFNNLLENDYGIDKNQCNGLIVWLDFLNALIFKVEASRINTTVLTGLMMLQLIEHGHLTYKEAFYDSNSFLGQFPGASFAASGNFQTRAQLLMHEGFIGMKADRQHPKWLMCTLKESIIMLNWLRIFVLEKDQNPKEITRDELLCKFTTEAHVMMKNYLKIADEN